MTYDGAIWGALACTLTALGGVLTFLAWQRRGAVAAIRGAAWSLLPLAAWLTGTLRLVTEVLGDVGRWATHLVFSPVVWLGICVLGVSVVLFGVSGALRRRAAPTRPAGPPAPGRKPVGGAGGAQVDDEIDAILRKHGIS